MRQLIARIEDDLHARLRAEAAAQGRSLNSLVAETLAAAVGVHDQRRRMRERARATGVLVVPSASASPPSREQMLRANRGSGSALSDALADERSQS
ncbi:MAG: toxin-antitoxin system HicB family antitoxin [Micromonosporaceae bacterium]|nr:toxin-antitoxin system HicB family antitoxin [Micromonosporaceae bacterium]